MKKKLVCLSVFIICTLFITSCSSGKQQNQENKSQSNHLEIAVYAKNTYLENVAKEYMKQNEGVKIDIITYEPNIDSSIVGTDEIYDLATSEKVPENYLKSINTSLMSKKGSDIIQLDVLPYYKYAKSGYLLNLNEFLSKDKKILDEIYPKMIDAFEYYGGIYAIPTNYTAYLLAGIGETKVNSIDELLLNVENKVKKNNGNTYIMKDVYSLFDILYEKNYPNFVNLPENKVNVESEDFKKILEQCKQYMDENMFPKEKNKDSDGNVFLVKYDSVWTQDLLMPYFTGEDTYPNRFLAKDINGVGYFTTSSSFGINKNSKNSELAWDFIKFMLSNKMQSMPSVFPINKSALNSGFKNDIDQMLKEGELSDSGQIASEYVKKIETYSEDVSSFHFKDVIVENIVSEEVEKFFKGETTSEETANNIQKRVTLYFKE